MDGAANTWLLNVYLNASSPLLLALSRGQLQVLKMLEVLCPLNHQEALDADALALLLHDSPCQSTRRPSRNIELSETLTEPPEDTVTVKNMSETIAAYQHTTRQNVYKLMQKGNLVHIRILDYCVACALLGRKDPSSHA